MGEMKIVILNILKLKLMSVIFKNSRLTSKEIRHFFITKLNLLMVY
jgi:hypothetical protein